MIINLFYLNTNRGSFDNKLFVMQAWSLLNLSYGHRLELKKKGLVSPQQQHQRNSGKHLKGSPAGYTPSGRGASRQHGVRAWQTSPYQSGSPHAGFSSPRGDFGSPRGGFGSPRDMTPNSGGGFSRPRDGLTSPRDMAWNARGGSSSPRDRFSIPRNMWSGSPRGRFSSPRSTFPPYEDSSR